MLAVSGALEPALLVSNQAILAHQQGGAATINGMPIILQLSRYARAAIGAV